MSVTRLEKLPIREIFPGFRARILHSDRVSESWVEIDAGATFPEHQHPHEQIVNVLDGELEITAGNATHRLVAGNVLVIPPETPHSGRALTACLVLDLFAPARDDYR